MNIKRLKQELIKLSQFCNDVRWDVNEGWIELHDLPFPEGWTPRRGAIRYELPETWPVGQPIAYLPDHMRYNGAEPMIMLESGPPGWRKHCIHELDLDPDWDTLVSLTRLIETSLRRPNHNNPLK